jgi:hypothetical protein
MSALVTRNVMAGSSWFVPAIHAFPLDESWMPATSDDKRGHDAWGALIRLFLDESLSRDGGRSHGGGLAGMNSAARLFNGRSLGWRFAGSVSTIQEAGARLARGSSARRWGRVGQYRYRYQRCELPRAWKLSSVARPNPSGRNYRTILNVSRARGSIS